MFYAVTTEGMRISAVEYGQLPDQQECFCPGCQQKVFVKRGQVKVPHFAHYQQMACATFSEGETERHLLGKQVLFRWLKDQLLEVVMEPWLPSLQQRPDLLVELGEGENRLRLALEYQCSPIPLWRLSERTNGYAEEAYAVVWLLGMDYKPGRHILDKQVAFMRWSHRNGCYLACLDSERGVLHLFQHIHYTQNNVLRCSLSKLRLKELQLAVFMRIVSGEEDGPLPAVSQEMRNVAHFSKRMTLLHKRDRQHRSFLERLYLHQHPLADLPEMLFRQPTKTLLYTTPAYIWKYDFFFWFDQLGVGTLVQKKDIYQYYQEALREGRLMVRASLYLELDQYVQPLLDILALLVMETKAALVGTDRWCLLSRLL